MRRFRRTTYQDKMTVVEHLTELRRRIIISLLALLAGAVVGFYYSKLIVEYLLLIPGPLVYLYPGEAFFVHLKLALVAGLMLAFPVMLYQMVRFLIPGLNQGERRLLIVGFPVALVLFVVGAVFAYQVIVPLAYAFFMNFGTESLDPMISIGSYVSFVLRIVIPFGLVFQLPLFVVLLTWVGIITPQTLVHYRKYTIFVVFILAALLTPPDAISQVLMAGPLLLLYELSILFAKVVVWRKKSKTS